jgi:hypothetical protein
LLRYIKEYKNSILIDYDDIMNNEDKITSLINSKISVGRDINVKNFIDKSVKDYVKFDVSFDTEAIKIYNLLKKNKTKLE